jgi:hypothetical protein
MHIGAKVRMIPHTRQNGRVKHLEQQPRNATNHHRGDIAMNAPCNCVWAEQPVGTPHDRLVAARPVVEQRDDLSGDRILDRPHDERTQRRGWDRACSWIWHQERSVVEIVATGDVRTGKAYIPSTTKSAATLPDLRPK